jgi:hypothetical protein
MSKRGGFTFDELDKYILPQYIEYIEYMNERTTLTVLRTTRKRLDTLGDRRESFDSIINKCADAYEELKKNSNTGEKKRNS